MFVFEGVEVGVEGKFVEFDACVDLSMSIELSNDGASQGPYPEARLWGLDTSG